MNISTVKLTSEKMRRLGQMFERQLYPIKTEAEHGYKKNLSFKVLKILPHYRTYSYTVYSAGNCNLKSIFIKLKSGL